MTHEDAFLQAIQESPGEDALRLIFADWLEESGQEDRAEFVRLQCRLASLLADYPNLPEWKEREESLLESHARAWLGPFHDPRRVWEYKRGTASIRLSARRLVAPERLREAEEWFARAWVLELDLHGATQSFDRLLNAAFLGRLTALRLQDARLGSDGERALVNCAHLGGLSTLALRNGNLGTGAARALAGSPYLQRLESLDLTANPLGVNGVQSLAAGLPRLRCLDLSEVLLGPQGVEKLLEAPWAGNLVSLRLEHCRLTNLGVHLLADSPKLAHLRELALGYNDITGAGVVALANSRHLAGLRQLDLRFNFIGGTGARALAQSSCLERLESLWVIQDGLDVGGMRELESRFGKGLLCEEWRMRS